MLHCVYQLVMDVLIDQFYKHQCVTSSISFRHLKMFDNWNYYYLIFYIYVYINFKQWINPCVVTDDIFINESHKNEQKRGDRERKRNTLRNTKTNQHIDRTSWTQQRKWRNSYKKSLPEAFELYSIFLVLFFFLILLSLTIRIYVHILYLRGFFF